MRQYFDVSTARLVELARRRRKRATTEHLFEAVRDHDPKDVAEAFGLPLPRVLGVRSFYDELFSHGPRRCAGTACWRGRREYQTKLPSSPEAPPIHCLGRCYAAPANPDSPAPPIPAKALCDPSIVLRHIVNDEDPFDDYVLPPGNSIIDAVEQSGLRGRGGAAFPTAAKWRAARDTPAEERVVVANGDEGDPGAFIDRLLLEQDPHGILAGMLACARAIGARTGIVFVRAEYPSASVVMRRAIAEAEHRGVLGDFRVEVICGAGSYVAGEESALLRAIEGMRAEPRPKPPFPAQSGLWGLPTVVQNVETLCVVPWVVREKRKGNTKAFCVAGAVARPGVVEAELGTRLSDLLERGAAGPELGKNWRMALVGGPMGRVVPRSQFDLSLDYDTFPGMGHGGIVVLEDEVPIRALAEHLFDFASSESCGSCAPCRIGTAQLRDVKSLPALERLLDTLERGSLCGFGQGVPQPLRDLIEHYGEEVLAK